MKQLMLQEDIKLVEDRIRQFEERTGCELLLVMAKESDIYPGAIWRFGVISSFLICFIFSLFCEFDHATLWPLLFIFTTFVMVIVGKSSFAKRMTLSDIEADRETQEKALEIFHTRGTSKVAHKVTAMIMASILEREIIVLVDEKLKTEITQGELDQLVNIMKPYFKMGNMAAGFIESINALEEKIVKDFGGKVSSVAPLELHDQILFL